MATVPRTVRRSVEEAQCRAAASRLTTTDIVSLAMRRGNRSWLEVAGSVAIAVSISVYSVKADAVDDGDDVVAAALSGIPSAEIYRLENGLQVLVQSIPWQSQVGVVINYRIGSRDDPPDLRGLAHLVEHMTYRGSRHLKPYGALALISGDSGVANGFTSSDRTFYAGLVPSFALPHVLWVESERMAFTMERFSEASLDAEKRAVENEYRLRRSAVSQFDAWISQYLFAPNSPYARPLDYGRYTAAVGLDDVCAFFRDGYRPDNALLVVVGGVDPKAVREQIELYFGTIENPRTSFTRKPPPLVEPKPAHRMRQETAGWEQLFAARWIIPKLSGKELAALEVLVGILRKRFETIVAHRLAESITVVIEPLEAAWILRIDGKLNLNQLHGPLEFALREELDRLWSSDLEAASKPIKDRQVLGEISLLEQPLELALSSSQWMSTLGRPHDVCGEIALLRSVSSADLRALEPRFAHPMFAWLTHVARPPSGN